ncbi:8279_t:CDS:2, partial [Funneliformis geosporum]
MDGSFNFYLSDFNNGKDFKYHDNKADFEYHDNDKDEDLDPNRVLEEENKEKEEDALINLPSCTKRISKFDLRYIIPNHHQIKDIVISYFELRRSRIINDLKYIPGKVSLTLDIWISTLTIEAFLGLSIHYVDDEWVLCYFLLDIIPFK